MKYNRYLNKMPYTLRKIKVFDSEISEAVREAENVWKVIATQMGGEKVKLRNVRRAYLCAGWVSAWKTEIICCVAI